MTKPQVLFIGELNRSLPQFQHFQTKFECIFAPITTRDDFIEKLQTEYKDIVAIYAAWLGFIPIGGFRTVIDHVPKSLKVVAFCSVGYDHEDAEIMKDHGIIMTNVPSDGAADPVADLVLYNTITSFRQFQMYTQSLKEINHTISIRDQFSDRGQFDQVNGTPTRTGDGKSYYFGHYINNRPCLSPRGRHVTIIGFGKIGQTIGKKLSDIGMNVTYIKRNKLSLEQESQLGYPVSYATEIQQVPQIDLIVIACPATPETNHMINANVINSLPNPVRIVNIGRGSIIDEQALVDGLKSGKVLFAGLDVFEMEPTIHPDLLNRQDVVLTPHIGASTVENFDYTATRALENIENIIDGGEGLSRVN